MDMAYGIPRRRLIFASPRQLQLQFVCTPRTHEGAARFPASFYQVLCLSRYALFSTPHNCSTPTPSMANSLPLLDASSNVMTCGVWPRGSRHLSFPIRASVARLHLLKTLWLEKIPFPEVPNDHQFGRHDTIDRSLLSVHRRSRPLHIPRELGMHIAPVLHELSTEPRAADMLPTLNSLIF